MNATVLIVEAQPRLHSALEQISKRMHDRVVSVTGPEDALKCLEAEPVDVLVVDGDLPGTASLDLIHEVVKRWPHIVRILITADDETAEELLDLVHEGVIDRFFTRPGNPSELAVAMRQMLQMNELKRESRRLLETFRDETEVFDADIALGESTTVFALDGEDTAENVDELLEEIRSELDRRPPDLWD